jgi:Protein of unknown function (DUF2865)
MPKTLQQTHLPRTSLVRFFLRSALMAIGILMSILVATPPTFAQNSPLELLLKRQGISSTPPRSSVRIDSSKRRIVVSRGRGLFTNLPVYQDVVPVQPRRRFRLAAQEQQSPLDVLLQQRRQSGGQDSPPAQSIFLGQEQQAVIYLDQPSRRRRSPNIISTDVAPSSLGTRGYCVRLCDGFFFPVGDLGTGSDEDAEQLACNSLCPSAETRLYIAPEGTEGVSEAASNGVPYSRLPTAYAYRNKLTKTCSCNGSTAVGLSRIRILADFTLEQGDVVMTKDGLKVLASTRYPHLDKSFVPAVQSRSLSARERDGMRGINTGGRTAQLSSRDKKNLKAKSALMDKLISTDDGPASPANDPQSLVRYLGANPVSAVETAGTEAAVQ